MIASTIDAAIPDKHWFEFSPAPDVLAAVVDDGEPARRLAARFVNQLASQGQPSPSLAYVSGLALLSGIAPVLLVDLIAPALERLQPDELHSFAAEIGLTLAGRVSERKRMAAWLELVLRAAGAIPSRGRPDRGGVGRAPISAQRSRALGTATTPVRARGLKTGLTLPRHDRVIVSEPLALNPPICRRLPRARGVPIVPTSSRRRSPTTLDRRHERPGVGRSRERVTAPGVLAEPGRTTRGDRNRWAPEWPTPASELVVSVDGHQLAAAKLTVQHGYIQC